MATKVPYIEVGPDGKMSQTGTLDMNAVQKCPWAIFDPFHYNEDGSCRCFDPSHDAMSAWGYRWSDEESRWVADEEQNDGTL